MKKTLVLTLVLVLILGVNLGFAKDANWEYISGNEYVDIYLDTNSVRSATLDAWDIWKCKSKIIRKKTNNYEIDTIFINNDTKNWRMIYIEKYDNQNKLLSVEEYNPRKVNWESYQNELWKPFVDKVILIGSNQED